MAAPEWLSALFKLAPKIRPKLQQVFQGLAAVAAGVFFSRGQFGGVLLALIANKHGVIAKTIAPFGLKCNVALPGAVAGNTSAIWAASNYGAIKAGLAPGL